MKTPEQVQEEQSQRIFWVIQTVFSLILARSLLEYRAAFFDPFSSKYYVMALGLLFVYGTALWSWIDFSYTTIVSPYRFDKGLLERLRFIADLAIVVAYAYLLVSIGDLETHKDADLSALFTCVVVIFVLYLGSGVLRIVEYGRRASRVILLSIFTALYALLRLVYGFLDDAEEVNVVFLLLAMILMAAYRVTRTYVAARRTWIAVDVDGVLANQIAGVLPVIKAKQNMDLKHEDVKEWDLKVGTTDIATVIREQQKNKKYVVSMPLIEGAKASLDRLIHKYRVAIVTARAPESDNWTKKWLGAQKLPFDTYVNMKEGNKQNVDLDVDVLIDDYLGNIESFLEHSDGKAILFQQPWNSQHSHLQAYIDAGRLELADSWAVVENKIATLLVPKA